jgi:hypothetical protein
VHINVDVELQVLMAHCPEDLISRDPVGGDDDHHCQEAIQLLIAKVTDGVTGSAQTLIIVVERPGSRYVKERAVHKYFERK